MDAAHFETSGPKFPSYTHVFGMFTASPIVRRGGPLPVRRGWAQGWRSVVHDSFNLSSVLWVWKLVFAVLPTS